MRLQVIPIEDSSILQQLVIQQIDLVEGQVQVIEGGIKIEWGLIILGCDRERRLVVLLLDVVRDENLLPRLVGVYTWIRRVMPFVGRFYTHRGLDGSKLPRIVTITPGYSETVQDGLACLAFSVEPYTYQGVEVNGERGILLQSLGPQAEKSDPAPEPKPTSEALLKASDLTEAEVQFFEEPANSISDILPDRTRLSKS